MPAGQRRKLQWTYIIRTHFTLPTGFPAAHLTAGLASAASSQAARRGYSARRSMPATRPQHHQSRSDEQFFVYLKLRLVSRLTARALSNTALYLQSCTAVQLTQQIGAEQHPADAGHVGDAELPRRQPAACAEDRRQGGRCSREAPGRITRPESMQAREQTAADPAGRPCNADCRSSGSSTNSSSGSPPPVSARRASRSLKPARTPSTAS